MNKGRSMKEILEGLTAPSGGAGDDGALEESSGTHSRYGGVVKGVLIPWSSLKPDRWLDLGYELGRASPKPYRIEPIDGKGLFLTDAAVAKLKGLSKAYASKGKPVHYDYTVKKLVKVKR
tara:strand:+ start:795 stop:1154 length:360 start_codon:yes stop_codon:yes gene_type:complete